MLNSNLEALSEQIDKLIILNREIRERLKAHGIYTDEDYPSLGQREGVLATMSESSSIQACSHSKKVD